MAEDDQIDSLLARYLELLDSYTKLRTELSDLQSSVSSTPSVSCKSCLLIK